MSIPHLLFYLPILSLLAAGFVALPRALCMRRRGTTVIAVDRQRKPGELFVDAVLMALLVAWLYLVVAATGWLSIDFLPRWLTLKVLNGRAVQAIGALLLLAWPVVYGLSVRTLGDAWRLGIDRESGAHLVATGIYAWSRHPIYLAFHMHFWGTALVTGRVAYVVLAVLLSLLLHAVVLREERFLAERFGDEFARYRARVGRYLSIRR